MDARVISYIFFTPVVTGFETEVRPTKIERVLIAQSTDYGVRTGYTTYNKDEFVRRVMFPQP